MVFSADVSHCFVTEAVRTCIKDVTNSAVEGKIKSWLRQARDRDGGRKRRYDAAAARRSAEPAATRGSPAAQSHNDVEPASDCDTN